MDMDLSLNRHAAALLSRVRDRSPLVHNITNYVVMNSSANILLAVGASPVMAHSRAEVADMVAISQALVLNIGTLDRAWLEAMLIAGKAAGDKNIPVVLDPVGAGATPFRTDAVHRILEACSVSVLRGNPSEVFSVAGSAAATRGVDSSMAFDESNIGAVEELSRNLGCVVAVSGKTDCITDGTNTWLVRNGHPLMTRITGLGCGLSALSAAFCAVAEETSLAAAVASAFGFYGLCGEKAAAVSQRPGTFETAFIDHLASETGDVLNLSTYLLGKKS